MSFDLHRAYQLAKFSQAAYADDGAGLSESGLRVDFAERLLFDAFSDDGPLGVSLTIGGNKEDFVVAFRGTVFEVRNWAGLLVTTANWIVNFAFGQTEYTDVGWRIHSGFAYVLNQIWEGIYDEVRTRLQPQQRLWITGHSLGGALANLAGAGFSTQGVNVAGVYTYGAPRVGDPGFVKGCLFPHYRLENRHDIVPHLPPPPSLVGIGRELLSGLLDTLEELVESGAAWTSDIDEEWGNELSQFLSTFVRAIRGLTQIQYRHAGSLKYFDSDGDLLDFDQEIELPPWVFLLFPEDEVRKFAKTMCDVYRLVTFVGQLIDDLENLRFGFLSDHRMTAYIQEIEKHRRQR